MLVGITDNPRDAGQGGNLVGCALGVTAGYHDLAMGILASNATDAGARVMVGRGGDGAGIEHDNVGVLGTRRPLQSALTQLALYSRTVGLGRATAKILYVKACHSNMVT